MRVVPLIALSLFVGSASLKAETAAERLEDATAIFGEIMATPDQAIPHELLSKAHCVGIVPGMKRAALGFGGKYGRGFIMCRKGSGVSWGAPAAIRVEGGSFGFQIGVSSTDVVMLVMNERGMKRLMESKFTLGGEASVAAGPVGRTATASTDVQLSAEILSWSRTKGAFAGVALQGATLRPDEDENRELYGKPSLVTKDIVMGGMAAPAAARPLISALNKHSRVEGSSTADRTNVDDKARQTGREAKRDVNKATDKAKREVNKAADKVEEKTRP